MLSMYEVSSLLMQQESRFPLEQELELIEIYAEKLYPTRFQSRSLEFQIRSQEALSLQ